MKTCKKLAYGAVTTGALGLIAMAAPQGGNPLVSFQSGTTALASEVNANFQANRAVADAARATADSAVSSAGTAQTAADAAQLTADGAVLSAASAQSTADNALSEAQRLDSITVDPFGNFGLNTTSPDPDFGLTIEDLGTGSDWLGSIAAGSSFGMKAVLGEHKGVASVGGHSAALDQWTDLAINPDGGNVGIGTDAPTQKLDVAGGLAVDGDTLFVDSANDRVFVGTQDIGPSVSGTKIKLQDTGNCVIDVASESFAGIAFSDSSQVHWGVGKSGFFDEFYVDEHGVARRLTILKGGNVGIGTSSPSQLLDVAGTVRCVTLIQTSDARLKTDVEDLHGALDVVGDLRGVSYEWDQELMPQADDGRHIGFLAQEVREVLPEAVREDENGQLAVAYSQVIPVLVEAMHELQDEIEAKDAELDELRAEVTRLASVAERVEALETALQEVLATR